MSDSSPHQFPPVTPGGSLILAWQIRDKRVLLVGGGIVASGRLQHLLDADALVTLISPKARLHPLVSHRIFDDPDSQGRITFHDRLFAGESDLEGVDMVLTAIDDVAASTTICHLARARKIPVNVADVPPECDFYFGSMVRRGPLQVMVSTGGKGPKIANIIKKRIEQALPPNVGEAVDRVGALRAELRRRAPGVGGKLGQKRMDWMIGICDTWSLEELSTLDDAAVRVLLDDGWQKKGRVPTFEETTYNGLSPRANFSCTPARKPLKTKVWCAATWVIEYVAEQGHSGWIGLNDALNASDLVSLEPDVYFKENWPGVSWKRALVPMSDRLDFHEITVFSTMYRLQTGDTIPKPESFPCITEGQEGGWNH